MKATGKPVLLVAAVVSQVLIIVVLVFGLRWGCNRVLDHLDGTDIKQDRSYNSLRNGMRKADVFASMGEPPIWTNSEFTLAQYQGNEKEYGRAKGVQAQVFYTWRNGEWFYCVGFDTNGLVVVKGKGGT